MTGAHTGNQLIPVNASNDIATYGKIVLVRAARGTSTLQTPPDACTVSTTAAADHYQRTGREGRSKIKEQTDTITTRQGTVEKNKDA